MKNITMVVPTIPKDVNKLLENIEVYFSFLPITSICIVGSKTIKEMLPTDHRIYYMDENEIVDFNKIKSLIVNRTKNTEAGKRTGWYIQQFIKLGYCNFCDDEFYLLWDSDTIPVKKIALFEGERPLFDYKTEYHKPYFNTIASLFPAMNKQIKGSFIAEHMLINTKYMKDMISRIEINNDIPGDNYAEKIINSINIEDLPESGFSEFETYGTYVLSNYRSAYGLRKWKSLRFGGFFFDGVAKLNDYEMTWLSKKYDAISFEKGDYVSPMCRYVPIVEKKFSASILEIFAFFIRAYRRVTRNR